jgi:hypothetical protein
MSNQGNGLGVELDVHAALGKLGGKLDGMQAEMNKMAYESQLRLALITGQAQTSVTLNTVVQLHPQVPFGRIYQVRMISIAPNPVTTAVAASVWVFTGPPVAGATAPPASMYRDCLLGGNIPNTVTYGHGEFLLRGGDRLWLLIGTTSAITDIEVIVSCNDSRERE